MQSSNTLWSYYLMWITTARNGNDLRHALRVKTKALIAMDNGL